MNAAAPISNFDEPPAVYGRVKRRERIVRFLLAFGMLVLGWSDPHWVGLRVLALYPLFTALAGWCPIYAFMRRNPERKSRPKHDHS